MSKIFIKRGISIESIYQQLLPEKELGEFSVNGSMSYKLVKRIKAVFHMKVSGNVNAAASLAGVTESTVRRLNERYLEKGISGIKDLPRTGRPVIFGDKIRNKIVMVVCQEPVEKYLPGVTHWSTSDLSMMLPKILDIESISKESVRTILKEHELRPHRIEYYLTRTDPDFFSKAERILNIYEEPPGDGMVICVDERTAIQVLERPYPGLPLRPGHCEKVDFHYRRNPTFTLFGGLSIHDGHIFGKCYQRHTQHQFLDYMDALRQYYPGIKLYIILDNLRTHKTVLVKDWIKKQKGGVEFIFTPFHGSWLNQIEIWFGILNRKCLKRMDKGSTEEGKIHTMEFLNTWNVYYAKPFKWKYTSEKLEELLEREPIILPK